MQSLPGPGVPRTISIVVPFYNEGSGVMVFHEALSATLARINGYRIEIICVDDGSSDNTLAQLVELTRASAQYKIIELSRNFGKEAALTAGIDSASGDAVIAMDADLQDPPELLHQFIHAWENGAEVVLARRVDRRTDSLFKRKTAEWFYRLHNFVSDLSIPENVGDFRLMDRRVVEALKTLPERQRFMKGLFCWVGFKTKVVSYARQPRCAGKTKFRIWKLWNLAIEGITSFSTAPLRVWTYIGGVGAALTALYALLVVIRTLWWGVELPGYASLLVSILFLGSLQLISLGLIGEYVGRIYAETKQRPIYVVRSRFGVDDPSKSPSTRRAGPHRTGTLVSRSPVRPDNRVRGQAAAGPL